MRHEHFKMGETDWKDLWQPELAGRISMVNSPREVIGSVLKYRGASYNSNNIDSQVAGGKIAVQQNLALLANQVRLFDCTHYLKAFAIGDVWVAVGWISDVLPAVKHMSNVAVVVPKSGASCLPFYFDIHIAIPAASRLETQQIGGRVRGPSPLIHQWIEFCLQTARALPCKQEVIPGASPSALESTLVKLPEELLEGKPSLDTNLIAGVLPAEILARCEFLEPLSEATLSDYEWLVVNLQKPAPVLMKRVQHYLAIGSGQLGLSITSLGKEASATLNIAGCTEMAEVLKEITLRVGMEMFTAAILNMSTALWVMVRLALKQWKRLTYPPMNENGWTNSDYLIDSGSAGNNNSLLTMHSPSTFPGSDTTWSNVDFRNKIHSERCWSTIASPQI
ncbi:spermidine/putrescine-binding periplasmic protein [Citrus sinensis]|uniref:Spermidine/putrescine-binding periplasmic protein n=1 Tax=Citrus sinensis TaxID=2711 RepID=A0ACB8KH49_CITSI|nr:spermidine/putrescine-binding periplasmic protein [Citrus sinensis]